MTKHVLYNGDSCCLSDFIEHGSIDLVVTSPPYNCNKEYEKGVSWDDHVDMIDEVLGELKKVVREGGVIAWNISSMPRRNTSVYHAMLLESHFSYVDTIVWEKTMSSSPRFGTYVQNSVYYPNNSHEFVYVYSNGKFSCKGDAPLDYALKFRNDVWRIHPESRDMDHPVPFPELLISPIIQLYSCKGDTVLDPFCGSGTTMKVARDLERNSVCVEKSREYCNVVMNRVGFKQASLFSDIEYKFVLV